MTKTKTNQPETPEEPQGRDRFDTPNYATDIIAPYLTGMVKVWECCAGRGKMTTRLIENGLGVISTSIEDGFDCLSYLPAHYDCVVTNPPYSIKKKIVQRFIGLDKPFAFLIPADWSGWIVEAVDKFSCEIIVPSRRINYITPTGRQGKESTAQFHSMWLTRGLRIGRRLTFVELTKEIMENI